MVDLSVKIGSVSLKNPIMPASGAFSTDIAQVVDINRLGALVAKTVSREYRIGNPPPRVAELECGMINSIGLPTKGIGYFLDHQVPDYARFTPPLVASITAVTADDFDRFQDGDTVVVAVEPGAPGIPWYFGVYRR
jgi:dihydroorotate dehydrogenase (NAD+) catalytic subunit